MLTVAPGQDVQIHYSTRSMHGNVIETSEHREPFAFIVGSTSVIEGLSQAVVGMRIGEKRRVTLSPDQAFGFRDPKLQQHAPRIGLPDRIEEGDQLTVNCAGRDLDIWIRSVKDDEVVLDANHPLSGESLIIDIELIGIGSVK